MNKERNCASSDAKLTQRRSPRVLWEILDAINRRHGPFKTFAEAQEYIKKRFRFQEQDDDRSGRYPNGWDLQVKTSDRNIAELSLRRLRQVLDYDPETGVFTWVKTLGPMCKARGRPGCIKKHGYRKITIDGRSYPASHLAWFHFYGVAPETVVDHKNLDKADDRIENLRLATATENALNRPRSSANTTGFKGVAKYNERYTRAKYRAQIRHNGKRIFLGLFHTPEEAYEAYCKAAKELHGEFARLN